MNIEAAFRIAYPKAKKIVREMSLFAEECIIRGKPPFVKLSSEFISAMHRADYTELYAIARKQRDYQLLFVDESFIQLNCHCDNAGVINKIRYSYYENPFNMKPIEELNFKNEIWFEHADQLRDEFGQKQYITPIRYDFNLEHCKDNYHPVSHLHVGYNNDICIPVSKILSPLAFICFVIKHRYYDNWVSKQRDRFVKVTFCEQKKNCIELTDDIFTEDEKYDLYLN